jgi:hypothetical protein
MGEVVDWWIGKRTADPERSNPTYCTLIDAVLAKDESLSGLSDAPHPIGMLPENPSFSVRPT